MAVTVTLALQTSSNTGLPIGIDDRQKTFSIPFTMTLTGAYVTGGFTLDLTQLFAAAAGGPGMSLPTNALPLRVTFESARPSSSPQTNLYIYNYAPGTTQANGLVQIFTGAAAQTALTELSAGALPAGVTGDTIVGEVVFPKL